MPRCRRHGETDILVLFRFQQSISASTPVPAHCHWLNLFQKKLLGSTEELEWNQRNSLGTRSEPGCLFLYVLTFLGVKRWSKNWVPWTTILSRLNKHRPIFHFATKNYKCRPVVLSRRTLMCVKWHWKHVSKKFLAVERIVPWSYF